MIEQATRTLNHYYGFTSFRPGQEGAIQSILDNHHTLAIMPTGGGKSLCYQIPSLVKEGTAIIISPLISLMNDQVEALQTVDIQATYINSSLSASEQQRRSSRMTAGDYKLVYVSPERFETPNFLHTLNQIDISLIAFDEAHCISQWGHDFRPSYRSVVPAMNELIEQPPVIALTATATQTVIYDIQQLLGIQAEHTVVTGFARNNLSFHVVKGVDRKNYVENFVQSRPEESGIIYTPTRKTTDQIHDLLHDQGIKTARYHAGMTKDERQEAQEAFIADDIQVMVATNAFGMGIDKSNVRYVLHYALPKNIESYYQEAGRAGRDGVDSECHLIYSPQDIQLQKFLIEQSDLDDNQRQDEHNKLQDMIAYCHTHQCLQRYILDYFGDKETDGDCERCSNCLDEGERDDMTKETQMILSCVKRMNESFGITITAKVLKGSKSQKVIDMNFHHLSTYGLLNHYTEKEIINLINYLVADQYLAVSDAQFPVLKLTSQATAVLKNEQQVWMKRPEQAKPIELTFSEELFQTLRNLRKTMADEQNLPPYLIFSDATLKELASHIPETEADMLKIKGIGEKKYEQYGEPFLEKLQAFKAEHGDQIKKTQSLTKSASQSRKKDEHASEQPSYVTTFELFTSGNTINDISDERGLSPNTIESHLFRAHSEGHELDFGRLVTNDTEQLILEKVNELNLEELRFKPIKEALPDEVSYTEIKAVCFKHQLL